MAGSAFKQSPALLMDASAVFDRFPVLGLDDWNDKPSALEVDPETDLCLFTKSAFMFVSNDLILSRVC